MSRFFPRHADFSSDIWLKIHIFTVSTCGKIAKRKSVSPGIRTHAAQKEGCAERIAPIGTLSQNGYGESIGTHKRAMGKPDVCPKSFHDELGI